MMNAPKLNRSSRMVLLGLVLSALGGLGLVALASAHEGAGGPAGAGGARHAMMRMGPPPIGLLPPPGPMLDRLLDDVKATPAQREQLRQISEAAAKDLQAQRDAGQAEREQMLTLFTQPQVDAKAAEALRQQMLARHDAASRRITQAMVDSSQVLTQAQRQQLADKFKQHAAQGAPHGGHGERRGAAPRG